MKNKAKEIGKEEDCVGNECEERLKCKTAERGKKILRGIKITDLKG